MVESLTAKSEADSLSQVNVNTNTKTNTETNTKTNTKTNTNKNTDTNTNTILDGGKAHSEMIFVTSIASSACVKLLSLG